MDGGEVGRDLDAAAHGTEHRRDQRDRGQAERRADANLDDRRVPAICDVAQRPQRDLDRAGADQQCGGDLEGAEDADGGEQIVLGLERAADAEDEAEDQRRDREPGQVGPAIAGERGRDRDQRGERDQRPPPGVEQVAVEEPRAEEAEAGAVLAGDARREAAEAGVVDDDREPRARRCEQEQRAEHQEAQRGCAARSHRDRHRRDREDQRAAEGDAGDRMAEPDEDAPADRGREAGALAEPAAAVAEPERERAQRPRLGVETDQEDAVDAAAPLRRRRAERDRDRTGERGPRRRAHHAQAAIGGDRDEDERDEGAELEPQQRVTEDRGEGAGDRGGDELVVVASGEAGVGRRVPPVEVAGAQRASDARDLGEVEGVVVAGQLAAEQRRVDPRQQHGRDREDDQRRQLDPGLEPGRDRAGAGRGAGAGGRRQLAHVASAISAAMRAASRIGVAPR